MHCCLFAVGHGISEHWVAASNWPVVNAATTNKGAWPKLATFPPDNRTTSPRYLQFVATTTPPAPRNELPISDRRSTPRSRTPQAFSVVPLEPSLAFRAEPQTLLFAECMSTRESGGRIPSRCRAPHHTNSQPHRPHHIRGTKKKKGHTMSTRTPPHSSSGTEPVGCKDVLPFNKEK